MNSNELLWSTATTAVTATQLIENNQCQVLTHEYLYTSVIMEAKSNLDPNLLPVQWIKSTWYWKWPSKGHLGEKKIFFPLPSPCVSFPRNGTGKGDHNIKAWYSFSRLIDRVHHLEYVFLWKNKGEQVLFYTRTLLQLCHDDGTSTLHVYTFEISWGKVILTMSVEEKSMHSFLLCFI